MTQNVENYESNVQYSLMLLDVSVAKHTAETYTDTNDWLEQLLVATIWAHHLQRDLLLV